MDLVTDWKAISIISTGAFGVLGLVTEFKDPATKKLTRWGVASLVGIAVSTAFGLIVQLRESADAEITRKSEATQTRTLLEQTKLAVDNTGKAITNIARLVTPLDEPNFDFSFQISCADADFKKFCLDFEKQGSRYDYWPPKTAFQFDVWVTVELIGEKQKPPVPTPMCMFRMRLMSAQQPNQFRVAQAQNAQGDELTAGMLTISVYGVTPTDWRNDGLVSTLDLPGGSASIDVLARQKITLHSVWFKTKQGRIVSFDSRRLMVDPVRNHRWIYSFGPQGS